MFGPASFSLRAVTPGADIQNNPPVRSEGWRTAISYRKDDVCDSGRTRPVRGYPVRAARGRRSYDGSVFVALRNCDSRHVLPWNKARFSIMEPLINQALAVRIPTEAGVERDRRADLRLDDDRGRTILPIHDDRRVMVRVSVRLDRPIHARGEIMLKGRAPAPDRRLIRHISFAIDANDGVLRGDPPEEIAALRPDRTCLAVWPPIDVAPAPAAPARIAIAIENIVREAEKGGRVALHNESELRIELTQRAFGADVRFQPFVGDRSRICARAIPVISVSADACPCGVIVFATVGTARFDNVMQAGELTTNPGAGVVLIRNRADPEFKQELVQFGRRPSRPHMQQSLRQRVRAAPNGDPKRTRIGPVHRADDGFGAGRHLVRADGRNTVSRLPGRHQLIQPGGFRPTRSMLEQV